MKISPKTGKIVLIVIGALMLACLICFGVFYLSADDFAKLDNPVLLSKYQKTLDIHLPVRTPDFYTDTHGGMTGDGDTIVVMHLNEDEILAINNDISTNKHWQAFPMSNDLSGLLYGIDYCIPDDSDDICIDGLLDQQIPRLSKGYYCYYNKQENTYVAPSEPTSSDNFIFVELDTDNQTLYIQEFDS